LRGWSWGIADQALSSLVNLLVGVAVARAVSPHEFGAFALVLTVYWVALGVNRALVCEPYVVRYGSLTVPPLPELRAASGTSFALGAVVGFACLGFATVAGGALRPSLIGLAPVLCLLLGQDFVRSASFATRRPSVAFGADAIWLLAFLSGWEILASTDNVGAVSVIVVWGAAAGVGSGFGLARLGFLPRVRGTRRWLRRHRDIAPRFLIEAIAAGLSFQLSLLVVGAIAGLDAVGAMRGAQVLFGPWQVLLMGTGLFALPEAARLLHERGASALLPFVRTVGGALAAVALVWGIALSFLPDSIGVRILGMSWFGAERLIVVTGLALATLSAIAGAALGLRALAAVERSVPAQLVTSAMIVGGAAAGAWTDGARGALLGIAVAGVVAAALWWWQLGLACRVRATADGHPQPLRSALRRSG
jgi:hypothetical protein